MCARHVASLLVLALVALFSSRADAFFDPPWITPEHPTLGDNIVLNIHYGVCDAILGEEGYPQITREDNAIRIRWYGQHWPEGSSDLLCAFPIATYPFPLGTFPAGDYTVTAELAYRDFFGVPDVLTIGDVSFLVAGAPGVDVKPVSTLGEVGAVALVMLLLGWALCKLRQHSAGMLLLALAWISPGADAQEATIRVLVSNAPGAPTPSAVLTWVNSPIHGSSPPLVSFKSAAPMGGRLPDPRPRVG